MLGLGTIRLIGTGSGIEQEGPIAFVASYRDGLCTHAKDYGEAGTGPRSRPAAGVAALDEKRRCPPGGGVDALTFLELEYRALTRFSPRS